MSFCNSCNFSLKDSKHTTKLIHDIIFHQETFETQEMNLSKEQKQYMEICMITPRLGTRVLLKKS